LALIAAVSGYYAPLHAEQSNTAIPGQYIVVYNENATPEQISAHVQSVEQNNLLGRFEIGSFKGFSAKLSLESLQKLRRSPLVKYVEVDQVVTATQTCLDQERAPWGLDRIAKTDPAAMDDHFIYNDVAGSGVNAYIIDTGILISHNDFAPSGRAIWGVNYADTTNKDCNGHGTHVAGTVGGVQFGVAKKTTLIAVKVLNCAGSGTNAGVINGINWSADDYVKRGAPGVANMSLGGSKSQALNDAVASAVGKGLAFVVAAGNSNADACLYSPSSAPEAITVGATYTDASETTQTDDRAAFSNWGTCLDVFAPGQLIDSAWIGSDDATKTISGTSMASPHVCGVAALYLSIASPVPSPELLKKWLAANAQSNIVDLLCTSSGCKSSPNLFLHLDCSS
jgi:subtilisin family serine protease